jgi:hypothetical protein
MTGRSFILVFLILLIPSSTVFALDATATQVTIHLSESEGQPLSDVRIFLDLYFYDETVIRGAFSDECTTDEHGECSILIGQTQDLILRGNLDLGKHGSRIVEWHGGELDVPIRIKQSNAPQINWISSVLAFISVSLLGVIICKRAHG